jgi:hypothetical protein
MLRQALAANLSRTRRCTPSCRAGSLRRGVRLGLQKGVCFSAGEMSELITRFRFLAGPTTIWSHLDDGRCTG